MVETTVRVFFAGEWLDVRVYGSHRSDEFEIVEARNEDGERVYTEGEGLDALYYAVERLRDR